jgi:DNA-binding NtrC family response regulator
MAERDVLLIEDDRQMRDAVYGVLLAAGYNCLLADNGREGLEVVRQARPSLVVTDLATPIVGGLDLLQQIRQEDPDAAVIVLTRGANLKVAIASLRLGAHAFLMKPVNRDELLMAAESALERRQLLIEHRQHQKLSEQVRDTARRAVLIVEEDPAVRDVLRQIFLASGYQCRLADNGEDGLEAFRESRPSLTIVDLGMPMMRGLPRQRDAGIWVLQKIRHEDPDAAVIVASGGSDTKAVIASLKFGADAFLMKPVIIDELLVMAGRAIERRQLLMERRKRQERH